MQKQLFSILAMNYRYVLSVLPDIFRELNQIEKEISFIENPILRDTAIDSLYMSKDDCFCYSIFASFPDVEKATSAKFITSIIVLTSYLKNLCSRKELLGTECSESLYKAFLDALILERDASEYYQKCLYKDDNNYLLFLVERCRDSLKKLSSYEIIKKYLEEFSYKYYSFYNAVLSSNYDTTETIMSWAGPHFDKTGLITCMEYSAACSSLPLILALFTAGFDTKADDAAIKDIIYCYFPWVNALYSLLHSYTSPQYLEETENIRLNFCSRYSNQKICETRILFFNKMAHDNIQIMNQNLYHFRFLKLSMSRFLTDYGAFFGINNITSKNIIRSAKLTSPATNSLYRFIKTVGILVQT